MRVTVLDVLLLENGELILAGVNVAGELGVTRLDASGYRIASFGRDGSRLYDLGHDSLAAEINGASVLLQPDGRLIAAFGLEIDVVLAPNGAIIYAGFGSAGAADWSRS